MSEPTPRQVLYALVAAGFLAVIVVLIVGAAVAGLVPAWWTALGTGAWLAATIWGAFSWRRTGRLLMVSIGLLVLWFVVTLMVATD